MDIKNVTDKSFVKYGKVLHGYDFGALIQEMEHTPLPGGVVYKPSENVLEALDIAKEFQNRGYGGMPIQIGYCNGHNKKLNGLEYHRDSEINVAITDMVLLLGLRQDITDDFTYDTSKIEAFLVPAGTGIEIYATTLHYAPCHVKEEGFRCAVILPKGTNIALPFQPSDIGEDKALFAVNKWLLVHEDANEPDAWIGLKGKNISI